MFQTTNMAAGHVSEHTPLISADESSYYHTLLYLSLLYFRTDDRVLFLCGLINRKPFLPLQLLKTNVVWWFYNEQTCICDEKSALDLWKHCSLDVIWLQIYFDGYA